MIPTIQILVLLLSAATAVAVLAVRLKIPPAIILVLSGVVLALVRGLPVVELAPGTRVAPGVAAYHLRIGGGDELARVPI
jgi:hypothetical protein